MDNGHIAFPRIVDRGYLRTMRIPLRAGRDFSPSDTAQSEKVLLVNETMARRVWPGRDPVGQQLIIGRTDWRVIGVVGNVRHSSLEEEASLEMYLPITQQGTGSVDLVVRTKLPMESVVPGVRGVLRNIDANLPTGEFKTLEGVVAQAVSPKRFVTALLGAFSMLAMILAALGIYGVISYSVNQRTQEIGIRVALGAQTVSVLKLVVGLGMKLALTGVALGLVAAIALTRVMKSLLYNVSATDPLTFCLIGSLLIGVALLACYIPARRAAKVDPIVALRHE